MWVLIDNYDSFTYILHHYLLQTGNDCRVYRNDEITTGGLEQLRPERIIISPGPETPDKAGICMDVIDNFHKTTPILGVCLGHQALGTYFGARLARAPYPMHGKVSQAEHEEHNLFKNVPSPFPAMRYHSLIIEHLENTGLCSIAHSIDDNQIMAMVHETYPCTGIQFHPESVGTPHGFEMLKNWANTDYSHFHCATP